MKPLHLARLAFGYRRTLDHLRAWQLLLPGWVKEGVLSMGLLGSSHGTRRFVYENLPQLKYHNPGVRFSVERQREVTSFLQFRSADGENVSIETTGLKPTEIIDKIEEHFSIQEEMEHKHTHTIQT